MISDTITQKIQESMKSKDQVRLSTLKLLSSALNYEKIAQMHSLNEEEETSVVMKEVKKRKDAIEIYQKAGANERAIKEKEELNILMEYLPEQLSDEELQAIVSEEFEKLKPQSIAEMGRVIGAVMGRVKGQTEGSRVSALVKAKFEDQ